MELHNQLCIKQAIILNQFGKLIPLKTDKSQNINWRLFFHSGLKSSKPLELTYLTHFQGKERMLCVFLLILFSSSF